MASAHTTIVVISTRRIPSTPISRLVSGVAASTMPAAA
jgi:hypothetical protein